MSHSPTSAQLELSIRMRSRRLELGMDAGAVSRALEFSKAYWSSVEGNRNVLAPGKLERLLDLFELDADERQAYTSLYHTARQPRWWEEYEDLLDEDLLRSIGLEQGASKIQSYEHQLVSGLLQIPEYSQDVIRTGPANSPRSVRRRVELRARRQERMIGEDAIEFTALMSEAALWQRYGTREVLRRQLEFLLAAQENPAMKVDLRVIPFDNSPLGLTGSSTVSLMEFDSPHLHTIAWRESVTPIGTETDTEEVDTLRISYEQALSDASLSTADSVNLIESRVDQLS